MDSSHPLWASPVEAPLVIDDAETHHWDDAADLVVAGFGGAGVAAALEAIEHGVSVIALDRYEGGGSSAANGGVYYAGGGTKPQRDAGESDTTEEMYKYLAIETDGMVAETTLRKFCDDSVPTVDWLLAHGALLNERGLQEEGLLPATALPPLPPGQFPGARLRRARQARRTRTPHRGLQQGQGLGPRDGGSGSRSRPQRSRPVCASTSTPRCASWCWTGAARWWA